MPRSVSSEWIGRNDDAMPGIHVLLRLYAKQNGLCACGCGMVMNMERDQIDCDHTIPLRDDGENRESNLQLMLRDHHRTKTKAENIARGKERRHKAKAFTAISERRSKWGKRPQQKAAPQRRASTPVTGKFPGDIMGKPNRYLEDEGVTSDRG